MTLTTEKSNELGSPLDGRRDSVPRDSKPSSAKSSHVVVMLSDDAIVPAQSTTTLPPLKRRSKKNDQQSQQQRPSRSRPTHPQRRLSWIHPPSLTAYLQNGLHVIPSPTPPPSTLLPDLVFSLSTSRLIHLLPSLPVTPLPRFLLLTLTLLTTHSLLLHDHDLHLSHDDLLNTLHTLLRTSLLIGLSWSSTRLKPSTHLSWPSSSSSSQPAPSTPSPGLSSSSSKQAVGKTSASSWSPASCWIPHPNRIL
ncbi:hypothetical protein BC829DRAFT_433404, partial [Chytridium lagenaria]